MKSGLNFTDDWFSHNIPIWKLVLDKFKPKKLLEIGSYEGRSACWLIQELGIQYDFGLTCIDNWFGPTESTRSLEERFDNNIQICLNEVNTQVSFRKISSNSFEGLSKLIQENASFDFIYIDGCHSAPDVLCDMVLSWHLLEHKGIMICDDYLWKFEKFGGHDFLNRPKLAIDSFTSIFNHRLEILSAPTNQQTYIQKN